MKTKNFYLCLLLLVLGTANVWADKYYQPWDYRHEDPRFRNLSQMVGEKFMIYNTSFNGGVDLTGFLYDNGAGFLLDKTKERDRFVYNERFVYVLEEYGTADDGAYAIRSITDGSYVGADGSTTHATPQPIYIKDWDTAGADRWVRADVRCENEDFAGVANGSITTASCQVFLLSNTATHTAESKYWNGDNSTFGVTVNGQPFAFYRVREVQSGAYLEDLHIFSRSDVYSAQVIWGYVQDAGQITTSDGTSATTSLLIDGDFTTGTSTDYLRFDFGKAVSSIYVYLQRSSADGDVVPANVKIEASANGNDGWVEITTYATKFASNISSTSLIDLKASYQYIRVSNVATGEQIALSEAYILPNEEKTKQAFGYFAELAELDNPVYRRASAQQYATLVEQYNDSYPEVKTLSGVPLPGNKYRIYADAYDVETATYVNKEICLNVETNDAVLIKDAGSYNGQKVAGNATTAYEWYCEQTNDGYLVFRNVSNPAIYLANNGQVSTTAYKWRMSTVQTSRFGVPLWDGQGRYLTIANNGTDGNNGWVPDVTSAQDQTATAGYTYQTAGADTPDNESDDKAETIESGICTDFVFIPVDITSAEKKITFTANEITKRNSVFKIGEEVYTLPYSRMFTSKAELDDVTFTLQCPGIHTYEGTYVNNSEDRDDDGRVVDNGTGVLTFDYNQINDGEVLDIRLEFKPFDTCNDGSSLYLVRSVRNQSIAQQAPGLRKADSNIGIGGGENDGPIQTAGANVYYAKFEGRDKRMSLVPASKEAAESSVTTTFGATSLFYFQETEDNNNTDEYYSVSIRSAITPFMCENTASWSRTGDTWYVQPNVASGLEGYTIGLNVLNATNKPGNAWCTNHTDGDSIVSYYAEDAGAVWEFIKVVPADAESLLKAYIKDKAETVKKYIEKKKEETGIDGDKADKYLTYVDGIVGNSENSSITVALLVDLSQKVQMLEHEVDFALQQLPDVTNRENIGEASDFDFPHWYYIYNVRSKYAADGTTEQDEYYAKYTGNNNRMALEQVTDADSDGRKDFGLANMFYFEGREVTETIAEGTFNLVKDNELTIDEYLQVDIHNFVVPDTTLMSKNKLVIDPKENFFPGSGEQTIVSGINLEYNDSWRIECEYDFTGDKFESFNTYGSCLLSSTSPGLTTYSNEFQVYLQDDRDIVVKLNNGDDRHLWDGTRDYYTNIKIVITHSPMSTIFDIYNSKGDKETFTFTRAQLNTITHLTTMLPANGVKIKVIGIEEIEAYNWKKQDLSAGDPTTTDTKDEEDTWYILPSSNTKYQGFSIVAKGANDNNLGWTNVNAENVEIFSDAGNVDNSTWQFVRIEEFDDLVDELLEIYDASDCVIYNKELAALSGLIIKNSEYIKNNTSINGKTDEDYFNEMYDAIRNYAGPMPDELKKPKPGSLYTIRPAVEENSENALLVHVDAAKDDYSTRELYNDDAIRDDMSFDTRSVWQFEGTADGKYLALDGLKAKNIHTLCYLEAPGAAESMVSDNAAAITLKSLGACTTYIKAGDSYLATGNVLKYTDYGDTPNYTFWGEALGEYPAGVGTVFENINGHSTVHCKSVVVSVDTEGAVTVTFTHGGGAHKLNILGVTLVNEKDAVVAEEYHHGTAGGSHNNNIYNLGTITPGIYTLNCYVGQLNGGDNDKVYRAGGSFTIEGVSTVSDATNIINTGTENTKWIIEEITDPENKIYYPIEVATHGHGTLMLGFDVKVPENIKAFWPRQHGPIGSTHYMSMTSYDGGIIPANTPVMLKIDGMSSDPTDFVANEEKTPFKFYYSAKPATEKTPDKLDGVLYGALYNTFVRCADYREDGDPNNHIFMLQKNQVVPQLYRIWENRNAQGVKANPSTQDLADGYIQCSANKAYWVMPYDYTPAQNIAFSLRYDGFFGGTTDIEEIEDADNNANAEADAVKTIFDLQGRKLDEITAPGIYIVNGVKVIVK